MKSAKDTVVVKRSAPGMGLGLFAARAIKEGEHFLDYTGEVIESEEADRRGTRYLFEIDDQYTVDGSGRDNIARYMNHFCSPNVEAEVNAGEIQFFALRDIAAGEELGYDYGEEYFENFIKPRGCRCPACR